MCYTFIFTCLMICDFPIIYNLYFLQSFPQYKVCLFSKRLNAQVVDIEHPQARYSPIFVIQFLRFNVNLF